MRKIFFRQPASAPHWVGDGFPVRSILSYDRSVQDFSPFLLLDHAGPAEFTPASRPRGVGEHPHRGFETVTIVYEGEVSHRDSGGGGGTIGPGDVQWMTAGSGVVHEEFHSEAFTARGGRMEMAQLWVNLPAKAKMTPPRYQALLDADIPDVVLPDGAGRLRVIAGVYEGQEGPAQTHTPLNVWDLRLQPGVDVQLPVPEGHTAVVAVLSGAVQAGEEGRSEGRDGCIVFEREGGAVALRAVGEAGSAAPVKALLLSGEPLNEPVAAYGPFVMNREEEIHQAIRDYQAGRFGSMPVS